MIERTTGDYTLNNAVPARQKDILKAFGLTARDITEASLEVNKKLQLSVNHGEMEA